MRRKNLRLKGAKSLVDKLVRYPLGVGLEEFLESGLKLKRGSKRWLSHEETIRKLSPEIIHIEETDRGRIITLARSMLKEEPKEYDYRRLERKRERINHLTEEKLRKIRCYPLA